MLKDPLYKIVSLNHQTGTIKAELEINTQHDILKGHFPGQPVLPGACMLQMVKEVLEHIFSQKFQLKKAGHLKFIQLIDPQLNNKVRLSVSYNLLEDKEWRISAALVWHEMVCFKFQGLFI